MLGATQHHQCDFHLKRHWHYRWQWRCLVRSSISFFEVFVAFIHINHSSYQFLHLILKCGAVIIQSTINIDHFLHLNAGGEFQALGISSGGRTGQSCSTSKTPGMLIQFEEKNQFSSLVTVCDLQGSSDGELVLSGCSQVDCGH